MGAACCRDVESLGILASVAGSIVLAASGHAQAGGVMDQSKISQSSGGFGGDLDPGDQFGRAVVSLGDLNGDGTEELLMGAHHDDDGGTDRGAVYVLFMGTVIPGKAVATQKISSTSGGFVGPLRKGDSFGRAAAALGDLDGDGVVDLAVGANFDDSGGSNRGAVHVLFLRPDGTVKAERKISSVHGGFSGTLDNGDEFGRALARLGDLDGDGVTELAAAASYDDDGGLNRGAVWILFMNLDGSVKTQQKISDFAGGLLAPLKNEDYFGHSIAALGDIDADGLGDMAVGAPLDDSGGGFSRGAVYVLLLNSNGTVKSERKIAQGLGGFAGLLDDADQFGVAVSGCDDLDGDGIQELAVGAIYDDDGGLDRGAVWLLFLDGARSVKSHMKLSSTSGGLAALGDGDGFGCSLARLPSASGANRGWELAVGVRFDDDGGGGAGQNLGAAYLLELAEGEAPPPAPPSGDSGVLAAIDAWENGSGGLTIAIAPPDALVGTPRLGIVLLWRGAEHVGDPSEALVLGARPAGPAEWGRPWLVELTRPADATSDSEPLFLQALWLEAGPAGPRVRLSGLVDLGSI